MVICLESADRMAFRLYCFALCAVVVIPFSFWCLRQDLVSDCVGTSKQDVVSDCVGTSV